MSRSFRKTPIVGTLFGGKRLRKKRAGNTDRQIRHRRARHHEKQDLHSTTSLDGHLTAVDAEYGPPSRLMGKRPYIVGSRHRKLRRHYKWKHPEDWNADERIDHRIRGK